MRRCPIRGLGAGECRGLPLGVIFWRRERAWGLMGLEGEGIG